MPRTRLALAAAFVVAASFPSLAHAQKVWVVAPTLGPGVDFNAILFAVNTAASGDLVLVKSGTYGPFELDGKGMYVVEDAGADVRIAGAPLLAVRNTSASQPTWLHGLSNEGSSAPVPRLEATDCAGSVLLSEVTWLKAREDFFGPPAFRAKACDDVVLDSCALIGLSGSVSCYGGSNCACVTVDGANGIELQSSKAAAFECSLAGGAGVEQSWCCGSCSWQADLGGIGAVLDQSHLWLQGVAQGGNGGAGGVSPPAPICYGAAKCGSPGVRFADATSVLTQSGGSVSAGAAGQTLSQYCTPPTCNVADVDGPGTTIVQPRAPKLALPPVAREGATVNATLSATPGIAALLVGTSIDALELAGLSGWLLVSGTTALVPLGAVPPSGSLTLPIVVSELGAGIDFRVLYLQAGHCTAGGSCALGVVRPIALLDAQF
ncbi:MAG: hypothetical protein EPO68_16850 [Planctomycetota bacterium]|nr:MAG: hypothetical protein EPO68_16850 [Planctomycetota bacterium]